MTNIDGNYASKTLNGASVADRMFGRDAIDVVDAVDGERLLGGGVGRDVLRGARENDPLNGFIGDDAMVRGQGADFFDGGSARANTLRYAAGSIARIRMVRRPARPSWTS